MSRFLLVAVLVVQAVAIGLGVTPTKASHVATAAKNAPFGAQLGNRRILPGLRNDELHVPTPPTACVDYGIEMLGFVLAVSFFADDLSALDTLREEDTFTVASWRTRMTTAAQKVRTSAAGARTFPLSGPQFDAFKEAWTRGVQRADDAAVIYLAAMSQQSLPLLKTGDAVFYSSPALLSQAGLLIPQPCQLPPGFPGFPGFPGLP